jgi:hypothetical protein
LLPDGKSTCAIIDRVKRHQASFSSTGHHPAALDITDWYGRILLELVNRDTPRSACSSIHINTPRGDRSAWPIAPR